MPPTSISTPSTRGPSPRRGAKRSLGRRLALALVPLVLLVPGAANAERILGAVINFQLLRNPVWEEAKDAKNGYAFRELVPTVPAKFRALFPHIPKELCLVALSATDQPKQAPILVKVGGGRTTPVTIVVPPGTQLTFKNTDPFTHRLYGVKINSFLAAETIKGGTRDWTVPGAGVFEIRDELAPSLRMFIIGEPKAAAVAYPSMKGDFTLTVKQAGEYTVQAFFAGKKVGSPLVAKVDKGDLDLTRQPISVASAAGAKD
jgi:plastocyanin